MATSKIDEKFHYVQNDPHKGKIKLEKCHFDILCRFGVIKKSLPGERNLPPPPRRDRVNNYYSLLPVILVWQIPI